MRAFSCPSLEKGDKGGMSLTAPDIQFSVAPMMDWTDRHDRYFMRLMDKRARHTEMVTADAVHFGDRDKLLDYNNEEHPLALQLGGRIRKLCGIGKNR